MKKSIDLKSISMIVITLLIFFLVIGLLFSLFDQEKQNIQRQSSEIVEIIQKASIQCYALEGSYPPSIEYIVDNYGVVLDEESYIYYYEIYGSNIMPDIQVFVK